MRFLEDSSDVGNRHCEESRRDDEAIPSVSASTPGIASLDTSGPNRTPSGRSILLAMTYSIVIAIIFIGCGRQPPPAADGGFRCYCKFRARAGRQAFPYLSRTRRNFG